MWSFFRILWLEKEVPLCPTTLNDILPYTLFSLYMSEVAFFIYLEDIWHFQMIAIYKYFMWNLTPSIQKMLYKITINPKRRNQRWVDLTPRWP